MEISSAVEQFLYTEKVTSSILVSPILIKRSMKNDYGTLQRMQNRTIKY